MLLAFRQFFLSVDPDVLVGYDLASHDIPFLLSRAKYYSSIANSSNTKSPAKSRTKLNHYSESNEFDEWHHLGRSNEPSKLTSIQVYSAAWVKSKKRMSSTSNQESAVFSKNNKKILLCVHSLFVIQFIC